MYRDHIAAATGENDPAVLREIEGYMREIIFHSTLDWQSAEVFDEAARVALVELNEMQPDLRRRLATTY